MSPSPVSPSADPESPLPPAGRRRRRILVLAVAIPLAIALLYALRGPLFGGLLAEHLAARISAALGTPHEVDAVEGGWLGDLTLVGVRPAGSASGPVLLTCSRLEVEYALRPLLAGRIDAIHRVRAEGLDLRVDARSSTGSGDPGALLDALPRPLPSVTASGRATIRLAGGDVTLAGMRVTAGGEQVAVTADRVSVPLPGGEQTQDRFEMEILREGPRALRVTAPEVPGQVSGVEATVALGPEPTLRAVLRTADGGVTIEVENRRVQADLDAVDLSLLPPWAQAALPADRPSPTEGILTGRLVWQGDRQSGSFDLRATDLRWMDLPADALTMRGTVADGRLQLEEAEARLGGAVLHVARAVLDGDREEVLVSATSATLEVADLRATLAAVGLDGWAERIPATTRLTAHAVRPGGGPAELRSATLVSPGSHLDVSGNLAPPATAGDWRGARADLLVEGTASLAELCAGAPEHWRLPIGGGAVTVGTRLRGTLRAPTGEIHVDGQDLGLDEHAIGRLTLDAALDWPAVALHGLNVEADFLELRATAALDLEKETFDTANVTARAGSLEDLSTLFPALPPLRGAVTVEGALAGDLTVEEREDLWLPREVSGRLAVRATDLAVPGAGTDPVPLGAVDLVCVLDWPELRVERGRVDGPLGAGSVAGTLHLTDGGLVVERAAADLPDLARLAGFLPALPVLGGRASVSGTLRHDPGTPWSDLTADLRIDATDISVGDLELGTATLSAVAGGGVLRVDRLEARASWGSIVAAGTAEPGERGGQARLTSLDLHVGERRAVSDGPVGISWDDDGFEVTAFTATALGGTLSGSGRVGVVPGGGRTLRLRLAADGVDLGLLDPDLGGRAVLNLALDGELERPTGRIEVRVPDLSWDGHLGELDASMRQEPGALVIETLRVDAGAALLLAASGELPLRLSVREGRLALEELPAARSGPPRLVLSATSERPDPWLQRTAIPDLAARTVRLELQGAGAVMECRAEVHDASWSTGGEPARFPGVTRLLLRTDTEGARVEVETAPEGAVQVSGHLAVGAGLAWSRPSRLRERLESAALDGELAIRIPQLAALAPWFPGVERASGSAAGRVTVAGTGGAPLWQGEFASDDLEVRVEGDVPPLDSGILRVRLVSDVIHVDRLTGRLGYGPVAVSGTIRLDAPGPPRLDLALTGENALLLRSVDLRLRGDLDLHLTGAADAPHLAGAVRITSAVWTREMSLTGRGGPAGDGSVRLFALREEPAASATLDLRVTADRTLRVENDLLRGAASMDLRIRGTGAVPEPVGSLDLSGLRVALPATTLRVEHGTLSFDPGAPFHPRLRAAALTRVAGHDLRVEASGPLAEATVRVTSVPALPEQDARLLLATGALPADLQRDGVTGAALAGAGTLLGDELLGWFRGRTGPVEEGLLDRITVEFGRERSETGARTVDAELALSNRYHLRLSRDRYDDVNLDLVWRIRFR